MKMLLAAPLRYTQVTNPGLNLLVSNATQCLSGRLMMYLFIYENTHQFSAYNTCPFCHEAKLAQVEPSLDLENTCLKGVKRSL